MSGIHFQNCSGIYKNQDNRITFFLIEHENHDASISLTNVQITSRNSEGIKVKFKSGNFNLSISNSTLSTGNNGVHAYNMDYHHRHVPKYEVEIANVFFNCSCLLIESFGATSICDFNVINITFIGCDCSPALSIVGITSINIRDVTFNTTRSQTVMHSSASSLYLQGHWYFYQNKGGVAITSGSNITFSESTVKFVGNNIQSNAEFDSIVTLNSKSTLTFI